MPRTILKPLQANDTVAMAIEEHARKMEAAGYGTFSIRQERSDVVVGFGTIKVLGETYDVALLRLANALLDHPRLAGPFFDRMRSPVQNARTEPRVAAMPTVRRPAGERPVRSTAIHLELVPIVTQAS